MVSGVRDTAETAVRAGIRFIQFAVASEDRATAIDAYLTALAPVPSPWLRKGRLSPAAERGRAVFDRAKCSTCHPPPLFTDLQPYNVGVGTGPESGKALDTPTLVEVWRTAPYLYDGRSATMVDVLTRDNPADKHGVTSGLKPDEIADLAEFILSQ
jgi:cytochrome c peroxidase